MVAGANDADDADAEEGALPGAQEPAWLHQAWAQVHDKDLVEADALPPSTGLTGHFDAESAAGSPASAPAEAVESPGIPPACEHVPALSQVLVTGVLVTRGQFSPEAEVKRPKCLKSSTQVCVPTFSYSFLKSKREIEIQGSTSFLHVRRQFKT